MASPRDRDRLTGTGRHAVREYVNGFGPDLADRSDPAYCAAHSGMVSRVYDLERRVQDGDDRDRVREERLRQVELQLAAAKPWLTLIASVVAAALTAIVGRVV